jgi:hypothetical protein
MKRLDEVKGNILIYGLITIFPFGFLMAFLINGLFY